MKNCFLRKSLLNKADTVHRFTERKFSPATNSRPGPRASCSANGTVLPAPIRFMRLQAGNTSLSNGKAVTTDGAEDPPVITHSSGLKGKRNAPFEVVIFAPDDWINLCIFCYSTQDHRFVIKNDYRHSLFL